MIINYLILQNIRSYKEARINFPKGSLLLSGDIGAGKSSILLSIEFALFGLLRGVVSGGSLLRNGESEGSVELCFSVGGKEYVVKRVLKRSKDKIQQGAGFLMVDGVRDEASAVELKGHILDILGYPRDLINKSKSLIFRYSVYTPQEEMKSILFDDSESRLDILRKVFGFDKYKIIKENSGLYLRKIRERKRYFQGKKEGIEDIKSDILENEKKLNSFKESFLILNSEFENLKKEEILQKEKLLKIENRIKELSELKKKYDSIELRQDAELKSWRKIKDDIDTLKKRSVDIENDIKNVNFSENFDSELLRIADKIKIIDLSIKESFSKHASFLEKKRASQKIIDQIKGLDYCPLCKQDVGINHKISIEEKERKIIDDAVIKGKELQESIDFNEKEKTFFEQRKIVLDKKLKEFQLFKYKKKNLEQIKEDIANKDGLILESKKMIALLNSEKLDLGSSIKSFFEIEKEYQEQLKVYESSRKAREDKQLSFTRVEQDIKNIKLFLDRLSKEFKEKEKAKDFFSKLSSDENWIQSNFIPLMTSIEKHVMTAILRVCDDYFRKWFNMLVDDDNLSVRLDDSFTPIIEQNGYETEVYSLSGGEKTSCALAYRLALNRVISEFIPSIKTGELLILDEPTDGFSSYQLDKVRDVLDSLNSSQTIIVSHEQKVEGFVDHVIRIEKSDSSFVEKI